MPQQKTVLALALTLICLPASGADVTAPGAMVEKLADGFMFTEGPACDMEGNVYFSDIPNERIHKWSVDSKLTIFRENSGKANGLFFDAKGNLLACEGGSGRLTSIAPDGKVTVLADSYQGKKLNSPDGKLVTTIDVPEAPANVCFGGKDRKTLFITARKGLYSLKMSVRGQ